MGAMPPTAAFKSGLQLRRMHRRVLGGRCKHARYRAHAQTEAPERGSMRACLSCSPCYHLAGGHPAD